MIKKILLTGGTGFIGSHVMKSLIQNDYDITLLKRSTSDIHRIIDVIEQVKVFNSDKEDLEDLFLKSGFDLVIHLATYYKKNHISSDVAPMMDSNITLPAQLMNFCNIYKVPFFINTGTFFEYDFSRLPIQEDFSANNPFNLYAQSKIAFETLLKECCGKSALKAITLKIFSPYGPYDDEKKLIPSLITKGLKKEYIPLSQGFQKLDFIYVDDIVTAYKAAIEGINSLALKYETFNVGSGFPYSIRDVVSTLEEILGYSLDKEWGPPSEADIPVTFADTKKIADKLGWKSKYDLKSGLTETIKYYSQGEIR